MLERLELEAFLTLAEELHFGRTANRLGLTTSRISQTIRRLERRIGAALFERNSRKVTLTNVGRQLRDDLRPAYDQINAGIAAASRGNVVPGTLMVGFSGPWCGNLMVTRHHRADPVLRTPRTDSPYRTSLRATRVDIAGRPRRHHTAADSIPQYWMDYYFPRRTPTGRPIPQGPAAQFWPEVLVPRQPRHRRQHRGCTRGTIPQSPRNGLRPLPRRPTHRLRPHVAHRQPQPPTTPIHRHPRETRHGRSRSDRAPLTGVDLECPHMLLCVWLLVHRRFRRRPGPRSRAWPAWTPEWARIRRRALLTDSVGRAAVTRGGCYLLEPLADSDSSRQGKWFALGMQPGDFT